ncbi:MFS transporter [Citricoccus sp. SGAir0253]|uniref:MFS transporter n=1 Tax=Citricoccus sp. SGAir0253 TaxID=2567881 RepID=UPI0010CCEB66|nr:MFS transporter [Citricoccus sp. SGAir0253]QCU77386.1 MFS transporter [Citricoccus sp. SGAir0253]
MTAGRPLAAALQVYAPSAVYSVGVGAITPAMAPAATAFGASVAVAAASVTLVGVGSLVANAPAAHLAARAGERRTIIASAWTGALGALLAWAAVAGWLSVPPAAGLAVFFLGLFVVGMAGAGFNLARQSYLAVAVPASHRARAMSTLGGTIRLGLFAGPFLGAGLQSLSGLPGAFAAGTLAMALAAGGSLAIRELPVPGPAAGTPPGPAPDATPALPTLRSLAREHRRVLATVGVAVVCLSAARATRSAVIPLWATQLGLSPAAASAVYGLTGLADLLMSYPSGLLMDRRGRRVVAVSCLAGLGLGLALVPLSGELGWFTAAALAVGLGNGFGSGIVMTLGADYSPPRARPQFLALWRLQSDAGILAGPALLSAVTALAGLATAIWVVAGVAGLGAVVFARALPGGPGSAARSG